MNTNLFARNLDALREHQHVPGELLSADDESVRVVGSNGTSQLQLRCLERWVSLNGRRDPVAEAGQWLVDAKLGPDAAVAVFIGAGLGYVLDALDHHNPAARAVIFEPEPACARALLALRDVSSWIEEGRLRILVGPSYAGSEELWRALGDDVPPPLVVTHPVLAREIPQQVAAAQDALARALRAALANRDARRAQAGRYLLNTLRNLATIAAEGDVARLTGIASGQPAIVVSAGPSLDDSLSDLAAVRDRAVVIAVDTALRPLLAAGISPDFVVSLDPSRHNAEHLLDHRELGTTFLVAESSSHPTALETFRGRTFVFRVDQHHPWPWLQSLGCDRGRLHVWGSVATAAFDLGRRLSCDPVIFCGQDLAYTGDRGYCSHTTWERHELALPRRGPLSVTDIHGHQTTTAPHLVAFRDWLVEQSLRDDAPRFVNASAAGILHGGRIDVMPLSKALVSVPSMDRPILHAAIQAAYAQTPRQEGVLAAARQLTEAVGNSDALVEPLPSWLSFAGETVTTAAILDALTNSGTSNPAMSGSGRQSPGLAIARAYRNIGRTRGWMPHPGLSTRELARLEAVVVDERPRDVLVLNPLRGLTALLAEVVAPQAAVHAAAIDGGDLGEAESIVNKAAAAIDHATHLTWHSDIGTLGDYDVVIAQLTQPATSATGADAAMLTARAARHVRSGGTLILIDLTDRVTGAAMQRGIHALVGHRHDFSVSWRGHGDWFARVLVLRQGRSEGSDAAMPAGDSASLASLIATHLTPSNAVSVGPGNVAWMHAFAAAMPVPTVVVEDHRALTIEAAARFDVAVCLEGLTKVAESDEMLLLQLLTALSDTIVVSIPVPGLSRGEFANHRGVEYWADRFLRLGYSLSDELRAALEDRPDLTGRSYDLVLYTAKKIASADVRLAVAGSADLRALISGATARHDELFFQAALLRLDRRQLRPAARDEDQDGGQPGNALPLPEIEHAGGHCYVARFASSQLRALHHAGLLRDATLEENGSPLARSHSLVTDIETVGHGRYFVTSQAICFSTSDNTDPRTNGRTYVLRPSASITGLLP
jgi:hypothetical protein